MEKDQQFLSVCVARDELSVSLFSCTAAALVVVVVVVLFPSVVY
jgi:hypothetical protein